MTSRPTRFRRLTADGRYTPVPQGWVPVAVAKNIESVIAQHAEEVERIATTPHPTGGGRPRKVEPDDG